MGIQIVNKTHYFYQNLDLCLRRDDLLVVKEKWVIPVDVR